MNCLYVTLFFNTVAGIAQTFIKSWNQLLYPRAVEFCCQPEIKDGLPLLCSSWTSVLPSENSRHHFVTILPIHKFTINSNNLFVNFLWTFTFCVEKPYNGTHLAFGGVLDRRCHFRHVSLKQIRFYYCQNEYGSQVKDQARRQCCHNKHKKFPYRPTRDVSILSGHAS
jgi:hypothetical protein